MVEGIELTLKSMLDVVRKFGVEVIAETNVPLDPNVHQAIAMVESDDVAAGNVLGVMQKGLYPERPYYSRRDGDCGESVNSVLLPCSTAAGSRCHRCPARYAGL